MRSIYFIAIFVLIYCNLNAQVFYAGIHPGKAIITNGKEVIIKNNIIALKIVNSSSSYRFQVTDLQKQYTIDINKLFELKLKDGSIISNLDFEKSKDLMLKSERRLKRISLSFINKNNKVTIVQTVSLRDDDNFIRINYKIRSENKGIQYFETFGVNQKYNTIIIGKVDGSPLLSSNLFFSIENPMFTIDSLNNAKKLRLNAPADSIENLNFSIPLVIGVCPENQIRRGFLYYLGRTRARKYSPFLHYNSWFDLSYNADTLKELDCMDRVKCWIDSLVIKRKITLNGFLWDSGWDDFTQLWKFNKYFPAGFKKMAQYAMKYNAAMGVWISPWGGYDDAVILRQKNAKIHHPELEMGENGFTLAGKNYYNYFLSTATRFVNQDNVHIFKFDGVGAGLNATGSGLKYQKDIESFLHIISDLRKLKSNTYFSLTVGTWPSPMWLKYGDNIWRGGGDMGFSGKGGNKRQQWMNFRDGVTYENIVCKAPLYPLNALMNHGITIGTKGLPSQLENDLSNLEDDFWAFFASGTSLQEMYVNPHLLDQKSWDALANTIQWARKNKDVLIDAHWYGGNPQNGDIYGFASWNPHKGILLLRNPSNETKSVNLNLRKIFEIPLSIKGNYILKTVRNSQQLGLFNIDNEFQLTLKPFEVCVLEAIPTK